MTGGSRPAAPHPRAAARVRAPCTPPPRRPRLASARPARGSGTAGSRVARRGTRARTRGPRGSALRPRARSPRARSISPSVPTIHASQPDPSDAAPELDPFGGDRARADELGPVDGEGRGVVVVHPLKVQSIADLLRQAEGLLQRRERFSWAAALRQVDAEVLHRLGLDVARADVARDLLRPPQTPVRGLRLTAPPVELAHQAQGGSELPRLTEGLEARDRPAAVLQCFLLPALLERRDDQPRLRRAGLELVARLLEELERRPRRGHGLRRR